MLVVALLLSVVLAFLLATTLFANLLHGSTQGGLVLGVLHGIGRFLRIYLLKKGFLDGKAGFINAVHGAFYAFLKYVRVDEGNWGFPYNHR